MTISLIVAAAENNSIGKDNRLLWHLPNDLKFFKNMTWGMPVIMGRKTFESVNKPLPGRFNIVITGQAGWTAPGVITVASMEAALQAARDTNCKEVFIIGGGEIYKQTMAMAEHVYLTRVHQNFEGDTFFPALDSEQWQLVSEHKFIADDKHAFAYSFQTWDKRP